jgi:hypothetical protein
MRIRTFTHMPSVWDEMFLVHMWFRIRTFPFFFDLWEQVRLIIRASHSLANILASLESVKVYAQTNSKHLVWFQHAAVGAYVRTDSSGDSRPKHKRQCHP